MVRTVVGATLAVALLGIASPAQEGPVPDPGADAPAAAPAAGEHTQVVRRSTAREVIFTRTADGRVDLQIVTRDGNGTPTVERAEAPSLAALLREHADLADRADVLGLLPLACRGDLPDGAALAFDQWQRCFERAWFWDRSADPGVGGDGVFGPGASEELQDWRAAQRELFEWFRGLPGQAAGSGGNGDPPRLGVRVAPVGAALAAHLGLPADTGVRVVEVMPDTPAARMGLRPHDVIVGLNDESVRAPGQFREVLRQVPADADIILRLYREAAEQTVKLTLP